MSAAVPKPPRALPAYLAVARTSARQAWASRAEIVGRVVFYAGIVLIFSRLWKVVAATSGIDERGLLWYLAITEWVLISIPAVHEDVERDIRTGDVAYALSRPRPYLGMKLAEALGTLSVRLATLGVVGFPLAYALAGGWPNDPRGLPLAVVLGVLAATMGVVFQASIGALAVWIHDVSPVYWIWQKAAFLLGGLILPLSLYPDWLASIARWSPFAALLYGPGRLAFGFSAGTAVEVTALVVFWSVVAALLLRWIHGKAMRVIDVNGG